MTKRFEFEFSEIEFDEQVSKQAKEIINAMFDDDTDEQFADKNPKGTVFISYSSKEQQTVEEIKQKLEAAGIKCWMAPKSIPLGSDYGTEIPKAIKGSKIFLLILSENSQKSKWVPKELDMAIKYDVKVIPFHIDNSAIIDKFEFNLINCQGIEAYKRKNAAFKDLKEAILTELKKTRA